MPDITLSPIPYNGGTMTMTTQGSHICMLTPNKFFALFGQTNPNYLIAATINVSDLKATSPIVTVLKQRVMSQLALTRVRVWRLSANRVLAFVNTNLEVYDVAEDGDISKKAATVENFHNSTLWGTEGNNALGVGSFMYGVSIKENVVWIMHRATTTSPIVLKKIQYDPVGDALAVTAIETIVATTTASHIWRPVIQQLPGTENFVVYTQGGATSIAAGVIPDYRIVNSDGVVLYVSTVAIPTTVKYLAPLSTNRILGLSDARTWKYFDGTVWSTNDTVFASAATSSTSIHHVEPIDENYLIINTTSSGIEVGTGNYAYRVSRFVDPIFGQTSTATSSANGLVYATSNPYYDQRGMIKVDDSTFVILGRASTTAFRIRVLSN